MEEPTRQVEDKVDNEEKNEKNYGLEDDRRELPVVCPEGCHWFTVSDCYHETDKKSQQREALAKKPLKITPQGKKTKQDKQDRINDIRQRITSIFGRD